MLLTEEVLLAYGASVFETITEVKLTSIKATWKYLDSKWTTNLPPQIPSPLFVIGGVLYTLHLQYDPTSL